MKITSSKFIIFMIGFVAIILLRIFFKPSYLEGFINTNPQVKFGDSVVIQATETTDGWFDGFTTNCGWYGCRTLCANTSDGYLSFSHGQIPYRFKMMPAQDSSGSLLKNIGDPIRYGDQFVLSLYYTHEQGKGAGASEYGDKIAKISADSDPDKTNALYLGAYGATASDDTTFYIRPPIEDDVHKQSINREIVLYKDKVIFAKSAANTSSSNSTGWNHGTEVLKFDKDTTSSRRFRSSAVTPTVDDNTTVRLYEPITVNYIEANGTQKFLNAGTWLESSNGTYVAELNYDGNLVVRTKADGAIVWSFHDDLWQYSTTPDSAQVKLNTDGNITITTKSGDKTDQVAWHDQTKNMESSFAYDLETGATWRLELNDSGELELKKDGATVSNFKTVSNVGRQTKANETGTNPTGRNYYLDRHHIKCSDNGVLTGFQLIQDDTTKYAQYLYNCDETIAPGTIGTEQSTVVKDWNNSTTGDLYSATKLADLDVDCGGTPIVEFKLGRSQSFANNSTTHDQIFYKYKCGDKTGVTETTETSTAKTHADDTFDALHENKVECSSGQYLTQFKLVESGTDDYNYSWTCVEPS